MRNSSIVFAPALPEVFSQIAQRWIFSDGPLSASRNGNDQPLGPETHCFGAGQEASWFRFMRPSDTTTDIADRAASPVVTELHVEGMTCNNCARHVTEAIQNVPGVRSASVALEAGRASVR